MKKNIILSALLVFTCSFVGCSLLPTSNVTTPSSNSEAKIEIVEDTDENRYFYGSWVVDRCVQINNDNNTDFEKLNSYIGHRITISKETLVTDSGTIENPVFERKDITNSDLNESFNITFNNLAITSETAKLIKVTNYNIDNNGESNFGSNFILSSNDRLYTIIDGNFFELKRFEK